MRSHDRAWDLSISAVDWLTGCAPPGVAVRDERGVLGTPRVEACSTSVAADLAAAGLSMAASKAARGRDRRWRRWWTAVRDAVVAVIAAGLGIYVLARPAAPTETTAGAPAPAAASNPATSTPAPLLPLGYHPSIGAPPPGMRMNTSTMSPAKASRRDRRDITDSRHPWRHIGLGAAAGTKRRHQGHQDRAFRRPGAAHLR